MNLHILLSLLCTSIIILMLIKNNIKSKDFELVRMTTVDNKAYWMYNNKLYSSSIIDGKVSEKNKEEIDSMNMTENDIHELLEMMGR